MHHETEKSSKMKQMEVQELLNAIKSSSKKDNLYTHLQMLYDTKIQMNDDKKFIDLIEDISLRIKTNGKYFNEAEIVDSLHRYLEEFNKNSKKKKNLIDPLVKLEEDGTITPITSVSYIPEYHNIFQTLEWVGISIGEKESYLLTNSLRNLAFNKNLPNGATFWGKIYGTDKDYYIAEASGVESQGNIN